MRALAADRVLDGAAVVIVIGFALILLIDAGRISFTWDESTDLNTVSCLISGKDPFACLNEPQQSRLPFYLHALVAIIQPGEYPHYLLSVAFAILSLGALYMFARAEFGRGIATLTAALYATSLPMLASGRMLLTHSNVIFTAFTVLTLILGYRFVKRPSTSLLLGSAIAFGLSVASSLLGFFTLFVLIPFYALTRNREHPARPAHASFFPIAVLTFFASTIIYFRPDVFLAAVRGTLHGHRYPFWNIFELGAESPWWFSLLLIVVKTGPWWILLLTISAYFYFRRSAAGVQKTFLACFAAGFLGYLLIKSALFYDAPHHHVAFYPFLYLLLAVSLLFAVRNFKSPIARAVAFFLLLGSFAQQVYDLWRFFPNYIFYGSQYGQRFIGEFYGPAVFHAQDKDPVNARIDALLKDRPALEILVADNNALERSGGNFVPFTRRDPRKRYEFAFVDRLYARHFEFPETMEFNRLLARDYVDYYTHQFPPNVWAYKVVRHREAEDSGALYPGGQPKFRPPIR